MNDLRIVIVSWNVEPLLSRCLSSLEAACAGLTWDAVVVDNASADGSVRATELVAKRKKLPITVIVNTENVGFAKAVNQGIRGENARYILLLNPDTECPPESLTRLVKAADADPDAGILGPSLTYPDGRHQPSVRRFPSVWSQVGIVLKLHHFFPKWNVFRRYFADDLNGDPAIGLPRSVDQVMGACFLIRRRVLDQIGGLDERYFIWFEEVDYCKQAIAHGWNVAIVRNVNVIHHGGQSFARIFPESRQRMFNRSLRLYFEKWHPGWQSGLIRFVTPIGVFLSRLSAYPTTMFGRMIPWVAVLALADVLSLWTVFLPMQRMAMTIAIGAVVFLLALFRPQVGLSAVFLELVVGSKGALFKIPNGWEVDGGASVRIVMFAAFFAGWIGNLLLNQRHLATLADRLARPIRDRLPWIALGLLCIWGLLIGAVKNPSTVLADANAWAFLLLLIPLLDIASRDGKRFLSVVSEAVMAGLIWLPVKTLMLLYVWSHGIKSLSQPLYLWVRRTGVAEVTLVTANLFRVFIQSQVYAIAGMFIAIAHLLDPHADRKNRLPIVILTASCVSILISLSRSFWIGILAGGTWLLWLSLRALATGGSGSVRAVGKIIGSVLIAGGLIAVAIAFPYPHVDMGSLTTLFGSRGSFTDAAAESRWNLLPMLVEKIKTAPILGSGFGATVTYTSLDPRIRVTNPDGLYTTATFEWGWLEHWVKFGILGIPIIAWLVISLLVRSWKSTAPWWQRAGVVTTLIALVALHVFTPYLNHPLGFGMLFLVEGWLTARRGMISQ